MFLELIADEWLLLLAMLTLMGASAFFSCSEAAYFSLSRHDRAGMDQGSERERAAVSLIAQPERLLTSILFWNLVINMAYFTLATVITVRIQRRPEAVWADEAFAVGALLAMILTSELLPKNLGVLRPRLLASLAAIPLGAATRVVDGIIPLLQGASDAAGRVLLPKTEPESYLALEDLERAVELRAGDTHEEDRLLVQERLVLQRLVDLAGASVNELMRARRRCTVVAPPGRLSQLTGPIRGDYLLFTEQDSDQIAAALPTSKLALVVPDQLIRQADPVVYVPWCATGADTLGLLRREGRRVAAVVNELGETLGIVTIESLLDAVLRDASRADPDDAHAPRLRLVAGAWEATGGTPLRRLAKRIKRPSASRRNGSRPTLVQEFADLRSVTVGGLVSELLDRPPVTGDRIHFAGMDWIVLSAPDTSEGMDDGQVPLVVRIEPTADPVSTEEEG